jgi:hypothetical protein
MAKTQQKLMVAWNDIPWNKIQRIIFKLQKRIYRAAKRGNRVQAKGLQRILLKSYYAKLLAVRQVTQLNRGKKTAGVDGVKSLTPDTKVRTCEKPKVERKGIPRQKSLDSQTRKNGEKTSRNTNSRGQSASGISQNGDGAILGSLI